MQPRQAEKPNHSENNDVIGHSRPVFKQVSKWVRKTGPWELATEEGAISLFSSWLQWAPRKGKGVGRMLWLRDSPGVPER